MLKDSSGFFAETFRAGIFNDPVEITGGIRNRKNDGIPVGAFSIEYTKR